jgi:hypothetical protein
MIKIKLGAEVDGPKGDKCRHGIFAYSCPAYPSVFGNSHQPLLDACRQLKRILGDTAEAAGLFREGRTIPDISCPVKDGALLTVAEPSKGSIHFAKYRPFNRSAFITSDDFSRGGITRKEAAE